LNLARLDLTRSRGRLGHLLGHGGASLRRQLLPRREPRQRAAGPGDGGGDPGGPRDGALGPPGSPGGSRAGPHGTPALPGRRGRLERACVPATRARSSSRSRSGSRWSRGPGSRT
jgi:hypothetical protein